MKGTPTLEELSAVRRRLLAAGFDLLIVDHCRLLAAGFDLLIVDHSGEIEQPLSFLGGNQFVVIRRDSELARLRDDLRRSPGRYAPQWALRKHWMEWFCRPSVRFSRGGDISVVCRTYYGEVERECAQVAAVLGCPVVHEHLADAPDWTPRQIEAEVDRDDLLDELARRGWELVGGNYLAPAQIVAAARVELALSREEDNDELVELVGEMLGCREDELPRIFPNENEGEFGEVAWVAACAEGSPLYGGSYGGFLRLIGHMYACGLSVGAGDDEMMRAIERVEVDGCGRLYSMTATTAAERLADEIAGGKITATVVTDLVGADDYIWPAICISERRGDGGEDNLAVVWVTQHPSRETAGDVITAYGVAAIYDVRVMRRIERAAAAAGLVAVERIDSSQRYIEAPMPAWYVREHCDVM